MQQLGDAKALAAALARSGVFLEARLLAGHTDGLQGDLKAGLLRLLAQMPNLPGSTPLGSAGRRHRPGTACLRAASAGLAGAEQSASARARLSAAGQVTARSRGRSRSGNAAQARCRCGIEAPDPPAFQPGADTGRADGTMVTTWQLELPMRDHRDIVPLQIKLQREDQPKRQEKSAAIRCGRSNWRSTSLRSGRCRFRPTDARNAVQPALGRAQRHRPAGRQGTSSSARALASGRAERRRTELPPGHTAAGSQHHAGTTFRGRKSMTDKQPRRHRPELRRRQRAEPQRQG